jgi:hypothetical protein
MKVRIPTRTAAMACAALAAVVVLVVLLAAWWYVLLPAAAALAVVVAAVVVATRGLVWFAPRDQDATEGTRPAASSALPETEPRDPWL